MKKILGVILLNTFLFSYETVYLNHYKSYYIRLYNTSIIDDKDFDYNKVACRVIKNTKAMLLEVNWGQRVAKVRILNGSFCKFKKFYIDLKYVTMPQDSNPLITKNIVNNFTIEDSLQDVKEIKTELKVPRKSSNFFKGTDD